MPTDIPNAFMLAGTGFVLTTVAGGILGSFLQTRLWRHQWLVQYHSKRSEEARTVFDEVSRLMDRRLFRLTQFQIWIARKDSDQVDLALENYRTIIREWNDSINRNLSLLEFYFGTEVRKKFDFEVGKKFVDAGAAVEKFYRSRHSPDPKTEDQIKCLIDELRGEVYYYNLTLLKKFEALTMEAQPGSFFNFSARKPR